MLKITIKGQEYFNEELQEFAYDKDTVLTLEHSLLSISKWEAKYHKPFMGRDEQTYEETLDYIRFMTLTQNVDPEVYKRIDKDTIAKIANYIKDPMTATWFSNANKKGRASRRIITSELLYYQMVAYNIPFECQKWHLNRLITLIRVCEEENQPRKKKSQKDALMEQAAINRARRARRKGGKA